LTDTRIEARTFRLVATADHKPPVLQPLAASYGGLEKLEELEGVTSGRLAAQQKGLPGIPPDMLATGYGYTFINASFSYRRPGGNRFNPGDWGAWYCAFRAETALREVAFHLTRALTDCGGDYDNTTRYMELLASFADNFHDLRTVAPRPDCLDPDMARGYPAGQALAARVRADGGNGIVYPSVRHDGGTCLVAFWPKLIRDFQKGETWILKWAGDPVPSIEKATA
jgi:RES domain-containing protein